MCTVCLWKSEEGIGYPGTGTGVFVNHYVGAGSESCILCKNSKCNKITKTPALPFFILKNSSHQAGSNTFKITPHFSVAFVVVNEVCY